MMRQLAMGIPLALALTTLGCGGPREMPVFPVEGKLFIQKKPAANAVVIFTPMQDADPEHWRAGYPHGTVQDDGTFKLTTYRTDDGAPAGEYKVTVLWRRPVDGDEESEIDLLQGRHADPATSKLRVQVNADQKGNKLDAFQVD